MPQVLSLFCPLGRPHLLLTQQVQTHDGLTVGSVLLIVNRAIIWGQGFLGHTSFYYFIFMNVQPGPASHSSAAGS